ncbi:MAG: protein kinase [Planctomycetaceae bacterium]
MARYSRSRGNSHESARSSDIAGDLGFADSDSSAAGSDARSPQQRPIDDTGWRPSPPLPEQHAPQDHDAAAKSAEPEPHTGDTWVPDEPVPVNASDDTPAVDDTWVPEIDAAAEVSDANPDPDQTWTPDDVPVLRGTDDPPFDDTVVTPPGVGDTWVPDSAGAESSAAADDSAVDPDSTWVPPEPATHRDFSFDDSGQDHTTSGDPAEATDDPGKTWVPSSAPTQPGVPVPQAASPPVGGTVVISRDDTARASDSSINDTWPDSGDPNAVDMDGTDVFTRTQAMRGQTEEEYEEWRKDVADAKPNSTMVVPIPSAGAGSKSASGRGTQIWSRASSDGQDLNLTIRRRPIAGDDDFEHTTVEDRPDYEIIEKLAEGGMGAIFIARQTSLDRELAIKTLKPLKAQETQSHSGRGRLTQVQKQRRDMFLSEALVTANLVHPHIIPIHDLCQTVDGAPFYSMKRVNGTPWNDRIAKMTLEENLEVLHKVCDAIAYAHHNGVVNRDLKPENIMLGEFGEVLVLDWGLAVPASIADKSRFRSPSAPFGAGTPAYMSPELWTGPAEAIGTWSDIYLLGAILFEALTGQTPHSFPEPEAGSGNTGLWNVIDGVVRQNQIRRTNVSGELMDIAMKAMSADPADRHLSVLEFQNAVKEFQRHEESRRLSHRADAALAEARRNARQSGYQDYQTAAALFEEAHAGWPQNARAKAGLTETRLAYAGLAHDKGDYDLGLQIAAQENGPAFSDLTQRLTRARSRRNRLKNAVTAAGILIVISGTISTIMGFTIRQQNIEIVALHGTKQELETQTIDLQRQTQELSAERTQLIDDKKRLTDESEILLASNADLQITNRTLDRENGTLRTDNVALLSDKQALITERQMLTADKQRLSTEITVLEKDTRRLSETVARLETDTERLTEEKVRAGVELRNADIASRIRNADYSSALREIEDLLTALQTDRELATLPATERQQRMQELKARERQLQKRVLQTEAPVQTQVISPSGNTVVWGNSQGHLTVRHVDVASGQLPPAATAELQVDAPVSAVVISRDERLVVAAAAERLHLWTPADKTHHILTGHAGTIQAIQLTDDLLLAADSAGMIIAWDLKTRKERWSIHSTSGIRDLALMPRAGIFLFAGSRGGESADVMAYQLPSASDPTARPERLGQLQFPRNRNHPPQQIAVSPDEQLLLISNSRNGDVLVLRRRPESTMAGRDRFPFVHAAELAEQRQPVANWILSHHQRPVNDIVFSADGQRVATASEDRAIGIWRLSSQSRLTFEQRLEGHGAKVNAAGFLNAAGSQVLSAGADRFCRLWDVNQYKVHRREIEAAFDLSATDVRSDRRSVNQIPRSQHQFTRLPNARGHLKNESDSMQAAVLPEDPAAQRVSSLFQIACQQPSATVPEYRVLNADHSRQRGSLKSIAVSHDGTRLVTGAADGTAVMWDTATGKPVTGVSTRTGSDGDAGTFEEGHDFNMSRLRFLPPDGKVLLTTGFDGNLCLWNSDLHKAGFGHQELRVEGLGLVNAVATSSDGRLTVMSTGARDQQRMGTATVYQTADLLSQVAATPVAVLTGFHRAEVCALAVSPDGRHIATGARDGRVAVWTSDGGTPVAAGRIHAKNTIVSHLKWLSDGQLLSAGFDGALLIVTPEIPAAQPSAESEVHRLRIQTVFHHDPIPVERVAVSSDNQRFVTISVRTDKVAQTTSYELNLWNVSDDEPVRRIRPAVVRQRSAVRISAVDWSPDNRRLAAVVDGHLQIFDTDTWRIQTVLEARGLGISDAVFAPVTDPDPNSPDVIATFDGTAAHLWNLKTRSHLADFRPLYAVESTALRTDPQQSLLLTGDRAIRIFQAAADDAHFSDDLFKISDPHAGIVTSLEFSPVASPPVFVSAGADGSAALWSWNATTHEARLLRRFDPPQLSTLKDVAGVEVLRPMTAGGGSSGVVATSWSPDGRTVLLATSNGILNLLDADNLQQPPTCITVTSETPVRLSAARFSDDGRFVATVGQILQSSESIGWIYDVTNPADPELHCEIRGHEAGGIQCLAFLPNSPYVVTGGSDGAAMIWNWQPSRAAEGPLQAYEAYQLLIKDDAIAHAAPITSTVATSNGLIATASDDGTAILWQNPFAVQTAVGSTE